MPRKGKPRHGSMQFWPRKRASKLLPSVNWLAVEKENKKSGLLGMIAYKVGMKSAVVKDNTPDSMTKGKKIIVPVTVLEMPPMKILSVRFYKDNKVKSEIFAASDKELKRKIKLSKQKQDEQLLERVGKAQDYDDMRIIAYSLASRTGIKKTPDIIELGLAGKKEEKLETIKKFLNKEIAFADITENFDKLVDIRGLTKGKGFQGPVKRFGIDLRQHKSEKGVRKVGSIGPWHPAHVSYRVPIAGQLGFFTRVCYNNLILKHGKISEKNINPSEGWKHYGKIHSDYLIVKGSVQGPAKRQLLVTSSLRPSKKTFKQNYEFLELR